MAQHGPDSKKPANTRGFVKSQKLDRTLQELESAFTDWESLSSAKLRAQAAEEDRRKAKSTEQREQSEKEFRKKTKKLLTQLRQQLAELND